MKVPTLSKTIYNTANANETFIPSSLSPDEVLGRQKDSPAHIPVKLREGDEFPDSDLLNALHYYISHTHPSKKRYFEETALLTLGLVVDQWVEDLFSETTQNFFAEFTNINDRLLRKNVLKEKNKDNEDSNEEPVSNDYGSDDVKDNDNNNDNENDDQSDDSDDSN